MSSLAFVPPHVIPISSSSYSYSTDGLHRSNTYTICVDTKLFAPAFSFSPRASSCFSLTSSFTTKTDNHATALHSMQQRHVTSKPHYHNHIKRKLTYHSQQPLIITNTVLEQHQRQQEQQPHQQPAWFIPPSSSYHVQDLDLSNHLDHLDLNHTNAQQQKQKQQQQSWTMMADISKGKPGGAVGGKKGVSFEGDRERERGGVATIARPEVKKKTKKEEKTDKEKQWRVLLHNDPIHTFNYVTGAIVKVVKTISRKKAFKITMTAHKMGVATVTTTWKAMAEEYCKGLQMQGLTSSIAPDSHFNKE